MTNDGHMAAEQCQSPLVWPTRPFADPRLVLPQVCCSASRASAAAKPLGNRDVTDVDVDFVAVIVVAVAG